MKNKISVLVVEDNLQNLTVISHLVEECGYRAIMAESAKSAFEQLAHESPALIILDIMMPEEDGYNVISKLKKNPKYAGIPVVFITAKTDISDIVTGFELGAVDYICKPFNWIEMKSRIKTHVELKEKSDMLVKINNKLIEANDKLLIKNQKMKIINEELKTSLRDLKTASTTDRLTGLYNRRHMMDKLNFEIDWTKGGKKNYAIIIADVDGFKSINYAYGYEAGDKTLKKVAELVKNNIRERDSAARWGDDEFLIYAPDILVEDARNMCERIKKAFNDLELNIKERAATNVDITIGMAVATYSSHTPLETVIQADIALRQAKAGIYDSLTIDHS